MEALRETRSVAQATFTKRAKRLASKVDLLGERALIDELRTLEVEYGRVSDAGDDYIEALSAVIETEEEVGKGKAEDEVARIEEKTAECLCKYRETLKLTQQTIWTKFAADDIGECVTSAETKMSQAEGCNLKELQRADFELTRQSLREKTHKLEQAGSIWDAHIPYANAKEQKEKVRALWRRLECWEESWRDPRYSKGSQSSEEDDGEAGEVQKVPESVPTSLTEPLLSSQPAQRSQYKT